MVQCPLSCLLDLWNCMLDRRQAEITVMQFRGHSLPVRQSIRVSWDFLACPILLANFRPCDFLSWLPLECVTSFRCITLEWHFWPGWRSKYHNITGWLERDLTLCYAFDQLIFDINRSWLQMGHVKSQSCAVPLRWTTNCWTDSPGPWEIEAKDDLWTIGFDFCVANASSMSMSLFDSSEKNLGYVFLIDVWTASSVQLYHWMLVCAGGMFVIRTNTSPSILNLRNCCDVIPEWS